MCIPGDGKKSIDVTLACVCVCVLLHLSNRHIVLVRYVCIPTSTRPLKFRIHSHLCWTTWGLCASALSVNVVGLRHLCVIYFPRCRRRHRRRLLFSEAENTKLFLASETTAPISDVLKQEENVNESNNSMCSAFSMLSSVGCDRSLDFEALGVCCLFLSTRVSVSPFSFLIRTSSQRQNIESETFFCLFWNWIFLQFIDWTNATVFCYHSRFGGIVLCLDTCKCVNLVENFVYLLFVGQKGDGEPRFPPQRTKNLKRNWFVCCDSVFSSHFLLPANHQFQPSSSSGSFECRRHTQGKKNIINSFPPISAPSAPLIPQNTREWPTSRGRFVVSHAVLFFSFTVSAANKWKPQGSKKGCLNE